MRKNIHLSIQRLSVDYTLCIKHCVRCLGAQNWVTILPPYRLAYLCYRCDVIPLRKKAQSTSLRSTTIYGDSGSANTRRLSASDPDERVTVHTLGCALQSQGRYKSTVPQEPPQSVGITIHEKQPLLHPHLPCGILFSPLGLKINSPHPKHLLFSLSRGC